MSESGSLGSSPSSSKELAPSLPQLPNLHALRRQDESEVVGEDEEYMYKLDEKSSEIKRRVTKNETTSQVIFTATPKKLEELLKRQNEAVIQIGNLSDRLSAANKQLAILNSCDIKDFEIFFNEMQADVNSLTPILFGMDEDMYKRTVEAIDAPYISKEDLQSPKKLNDTATGQAPNNGLLPQFDVAVAALRSKYQKGIEKTNERKSQAAKMKEEIIKLEGEMADLSSTLEKIEELISHFEMNNEHGSRMNTAEREELEFLRGKYRQLEIKLAECKRKSSTGEQVFPSGSQLLPSGVPVTPSTQEQDSITGEEAAPPPSVDNEEEDLQVLNSGNSGRASPSSINDEDEERKSESSGSGVSVAKGISDSVRVRCGSCNRDFSQRAYKFHPWRCSGKQRKRSIEGSDDGDNRKGRNVVPRR
ncbi:unnamed protein product [Orchesella dallaii]|uniref:Uncharacterized protein n=1 Tax=Orchesella dallaii TaxID=48710 RepID=A0ABP1RA93_9HEXA